MSNAEARNRVREGALWLDRVKPGWASRIDLDRLDVSHSDRCPGAQAFGDWQKLSDYVRSHVIGDMGSYDGGEEWKRTHGFLEGFDSDGDFVARYSELNEAWKAEVGRRRSGVAGSVPARRDDWQTIVAGIRGDIMSAAANAPVFIESADGTLFRLTTVRSEVIDGQPHVFLVADPEEFVVETTTTLRRRSG
jgi:hypothetical protein